MDVGFQYFAEQQPEFIALVDPSGREWSRGELAALANRLARALIASGLAEGDAIAIIAPNCAEYLAVYFAGLQAGLSVVPINWHLAEEEIAFVLRDSEVRAIFAHEDLGPKLLAGVQAKRANAEHLIAIGTAAGYVPMSEFIATHSEAPLGTGNTGRMMAYTSATTGRPKAVKLPQRDGNETLGQIVPVNRMLGILPEDDNVHLCASMLYHSAPLGGVEVALQMGHRVILVGRWQPELLLQLIDRHRVTTTFMVPAMFIRLLKIPKNAREGYSTASLRFVMHGAAPCPLDIKRQMIEWWGDVIWEAYGATEAQGTLVSAKEWLQRPGTVGKPMPGSALKILDEAGHELSPFEVGQVYIQPRMGDWFEYKGDEAKTRASYRGEFVTVGDLGYVDEEGYLFLCGRANDLIISSGMNIYAAEIETVLVQHPLVRDCAVIGEPHALLGEVPKAFVELEPGADGGSMRTAELLRFLGQRLSAMKLPKRIEYVDRLPRDPNGKLFKRLLPRSFAGGRT